MILDINVNFFQAHKDNLIISNKKKNKNSQKLYQFIGTYSARFCANHDIKLHFQNVLHMKLSSHSIMQINLMMSIISLLK